MRRTHSGRTYAERTARGRPDAGRAGAGRDAAAARPTAGPPPASAPLTERSARIVAAHKLLRRPRRLQAGEFLADGAQAVREAIAAERDHPGTVLELFITKTGAARNTGLVREAFAARVTVTEVTDAAAAKISDAVTPQGLTARCALPAGAGAPPRGPAEATRDRPGDASRERPFDAASPEVEAAVTELLSASPRLIAVLVENSDPGNAGTVIRLADAAGADGVIVAGEAVDPWGPKAVRASAGSIFHLPVVRAADPGTLPAVLRRAGLAVVATTGAAEVDLDAARDAGTLAAPTAWLFGSEAHGLPAELLSAADTAIRVPIHGRAESLNLATAAAVCLYASASAQRRRGT